MQRTLDSVLFSWSGLSRTSLVYLIRSIYFQERQMWSEGNFRSPIYCYAKRFFTRKKFLANTTYAMLIVLWVSEISVKPVNTKCTEHIICTFLFLRHHRLRLLPIKRGRGGKKRSSVPRSPDGEFDHGFNVVISRIIFWNSFNIAFFKKKIPNWF